MSCPIAVRGRKEHITIARRSAAKTVFSAFIRMQRQLSTARNDMRQGMKLVRSCWSTVAQFGIYQVRSSELPLPPSRFKSLRSCRTVYSWRMLTLRRTALQALMLFRDHRARARMTPVLSLRHRLQNLPRVYLPPVSLSSNCVAGTRHFEKSSDCCLHYFSRHHFCRSCLYMPY